MTADELPCTAPREPANFRLYSLGPHYEDLPLTTIIRRCDNPSADGRANYVSYIYGDCDPGPLPGEEYADGGCAPPLEIQVWPACERAFGDYDVIPSPDRAERRGVPSAALADRVELYSADSTVVIFGASPKEAEQAAGAVKAAPQAASALDAAESAEEITLPSPVAGAVEGKLRCSSSAAEGSS